jgi:hypothetical protein
MPGLRSRRCTTAQPVTRRWLLSMSGPAADLITRFIATEIGEETESIRCQILAPAITAAEQTAIEEPGRGLAVGEVPGTMLARVQPPVAPLPATTRTASGGLS